MRFLKIAVVSLQMLVMQTAFAEVVHVDEKGSKVEWTGSKVVGSEHVGTIKVKSGEITTTKLKPTAATVVVDMKSIVNTDLSDEKWNKKLIGHLNSDDFFAVEKFPEAVIKVTEFSSKGGVDYDLKGKLTIKGVTKDVSLKAKIVGKPDSVQAINATLEFDRTDFNIRYGSGKFFDDLGDKMISDSIQLKIELKLKTALKLG